MPSPAQDQPMHASDRLTGPILGLAGALALLSASCCVLPIGLTILGVGGAWLTYLGPFVAYRPQILTAVGLVLILALIKILRTPPCKGRRSHTWMLACFATAAFLLAASSPLWEAEAQRAMWALWKETRS